MGRSPKRQTFPRKAATSLTEKILLMVEFLEGGSLGVPTAQHRKDK